MTEHKQAKKNSTRSKGKFAENRAADLLRSEGMEILAQNYTVWGGEIDIIALEKPNTLVFVEVKYRKSKSFGSGAESVGRVKQERLVRCAESYISQNGLEDMNARFDVMEADGLSFRRIENAFEVN